MNRLVTLLSLSAALAIGGCTHSQDKSTQDNSSMSAANGSTPTKSSNEGSAQTAAAVDLHNTVCPVSGDKVESSKLTQTYDGKVYHLCCNDCVKPFKADPTKYTKAVSDDPAKYGVQAKAAQ